MEPILYECRSVLRDMMDIKYMGCPFREQNDSTPCGNCEACLFTTAVSCRNVDLCSRLDAMLAERNGMTEPEDRMNINVLVFKRGCVLTMRTNSFSFSAGISHAEMKELAEKLTKAFDEMAERGRNEL